MTTELIIAVSGSVIESNLESFRAEALETIKGANKALETKEDFATAETTIKHCKEYEKVLAGVKEKALAQTGDLDALFATIDDLEEEFRKTRLSLDKQVKREKARVKAEFVQKGKEKVQRYITVSSLPESYTLSTSSIDTSVKGKKTEASTEKAVKVAVDSLISEIDETEKGYLLGCEAIAKIEQEVPGLFPDRDTLALKPIETLKAIIESRVAKFKLAQKEQKEKELDQAPTKTESEESAKEHSTGSAVPSVNEPAINQGEEVVSNEQAYLFTLKIVCSRERAIEIAKELDVFSDQFGEKTGCSLSAA